jgi:hypothetical protein
MLSHWEPLTLFLRVPGAPLDSGIVEPALKKAILHRSYVHPPITLAVSDSVARHARPIEV